jgi:4-amino-4-deoxy-L-arabinose transferase-like glycosyltransferase
VLSRLAGWLAWLVPLGIYAASLNGAVGYWDTGEAQTVPWIFGIMHPTGFPAFTMLAGVFAHVFAIGSVAWRIALFCALAMTAAAWFVYRIVLELDGEVWLGVASAWLFAFGDVAWTRGTRAEVHALAAFFAIATLYAAIRWYRTGEQRALVLGALAWGLGIATHPIAALLAPALLLLFAARIRSVTLRGFALALCALLFGIAWYAYLPARSASVTAMHADPTRTLGIPPGRPFWDNDHPASPGGFKKEISGDEFGAGGAVTRIFSPQTYRDGFAAYAGVLVGEATPLGVVLALGGLYALFRRDEPLASALLLAFAFPTAFGLAYTIEADPARYYLIGFAVVAVFAGYAATEIVRALPALSRPVYVLLFGLAAALLALNSGTFAQRDSSGAQAMISSVVKNTPGNAVLITPWIDATALAYGAYVEHRLGNRIVETSWLADDAKLVPSWTRSRPVYVVGTVWGHVPGYRLVKVSASPDLFRVVSLRASSHSRSR